MSAPDTAVPEIRVEGLRKSFGRGPGSVIAVDDLSFSVRPGRVTGFLGPNGAGKTTTLRCLLGLVTPTRGSVRFGGQAYQDLPNPATTVGAALESSGFHPGRSARDHLLVRALATGLPAERAEESLDFVGLGDSGNRPVAGFSLGMRQRLALASALLGRPGILVLDEPANGLDPAGIAWLRNFLRGFAASGGTVLVSSHVLSEIRQTVDDVVIIDRGRLIRSGRLADLLGGNGGDRVRVTGPDLGRLLRAAAARGGTVLEPPEAGPGQAQPRDDPGAGGPVVPVRAATISGLSSELIGRIAFEQQVELHQLRDLDSDLETVFLRMTGEPAPGSGGTT